MPIGNWQNWMSRNLSEIFISLEKILLKPNQTKVRIGYDLEIL